MSTKTPPPFNSRPILAICASAHSYSQVIDLSEEITELGFDAILPDLAKQMKGSGQANFEAKIDFANHLDGYTYKAKLMRQHFSQIESCNAVLVLNFEKNGQANYIGGNVLMEMTVAFYLHKPIYIYYAAPTQSPLLDEILGMQPIFLKGELHDLSQYFITAK